MKTGQVISILLLSVAISAQAATTESRNAQSPARITIETTLAERQARDWGLQPEEWSRYKEVMQGPLGTYSPQLDPLTALGIEARTEAERRHYAELQVRAESRRVEKTLAYQRAYDAAWQRLFPSLQRVNLAETDSPSTSPSLTRSQGRLAVFIKEGCPSCEQRVQQLQASGSAFDLYMVGSRQDDSRIRQWAARVSIDPAKVRARTITLNHDSGRWLSLGLAGDLPAVVKEVNGQWQRQ